MAKTFLQARDAYLELIGKEVDELIKDFPSGAINNALAVMSSKENNFLVSKVKCSKTFNVIERALPELEKKIKDKKVGPARDKFKEIEDAHKDLTEYGEKNKKQPVLYEHIKTLDELLETWLKKSGEKTKNERKELETECGPGMVEKVYKELDNLKKLIDED